MKIKKIVHYKVIGVSWFYLSKWSVRMDAQDPPALSMWTENNTSGTCFFIPMTDHLARLVQQVVSEGDEAEEAFILFWDEILMMAPTINLLFKEKGVAPEFWLPD